MPLIGGGHGHWLAVTSPAEYRPDPGSPLLAEPPVTLSIIVNVKAAVSATTSAMRLRPHLSGVLMNTT
jgi:hypothetical protein